MDRSNQFEKYESLIEQLDEMIADKGRGFNIARELNDELWQEMEAKKDEMTNQISRMRTINSEEELQQEIINADSIYEATRNYIAKFGNKE